MSYLAIFNYLGSNRLKIAIIFTSDAELTNDAFCIDAYY